MAHILNVLNKETGEYVGIPAITGENGKDGKSAYEIALDNGFEGTEEEWLESLKSTETQVDLSNYYNKEEVDNAIANAEVDVDLTNYYTKTEVDSIVDNVEVDVDMSNYYTKEEVNNVIDNIEVNGVVDELTVKRKSDDNSIIELPYEFDETLKDATLDPLRVYTNSTVETNFTFDKMLYLIADKLPKSVGINEYKELAYSDNMTISDIAEDQYLVDYIIFNPKLIGNNTNTLFKSDISIKKVLEDYENKGQYSVTIWDEEKQTIASKTYLYDSYEAGHVFERTLFYFHFYPDREYTITMTNGTAIYKPFGYDDFVDGWTFLECQTLTNSVTLPGSARGEDYVSPFGSSGDGFYIAPENGAVFTVSDGTNTMTFNSNGIVNAPQYELTVSNGTESNTIVFTLTSENGEYYVRQRDIQIVTRYDMDNLGGSGSVDLTGYATETYVDNKITGLATTSYVDNQVKNEVLTTYISIGDLNTRKGTSISFVAGEDNTQKIIDALESREQFIDWLGNSLTANRFGINPKIYGSRINELKITKLKDTIVTAIMNSGAVLSRIYTDGALGDWTSTGHILNDGYSDDGTISITGQNEDSTGMYANGVLPETLGFTNDAMTWDNGIYRISHGNNALVGLPENLQSGRLEHFNLKRWQGNHNPHTKDWAERMSIFYSSNGNIYTRAQVSGASAGTLYSDTGWKQIATTDNTLRYQVVTSAPATQEEGVLYIVT